ncbi:hypothetical protein GCM10010515_01700 [Streptomyces fructofermentans]|uniref:Uncharacterized protein n=1 Tax=Streptomyces fructofermentans TaxID=152141 RepID=A0A918K027_9ACTN|nr:hypothetical protein GCM10010515_01700 [Streptomyces fructofermentans]
MESPDPTAAARPAGTDPAATVRPVTDPTAADGAVPVPEAGGPAGPRPLDFVDDPAVRAELARRMAELAELLDEAGEALGGILQDVRRGFDSAARSRGADGPST